MKSNWKALLSQSICSAEGAQQFLSLSDEDTEQMAKIIERYPVCANPYYLSLIDKNDPQDPIRKMCIPDIHEFSEGGQADTSGEAENTVIQGMQHKYRQTAMILSTNQCAMYCRHCFRKRIVGASSEEIASQLPAMADYIRSHKEKGRLLWCNAILYNCKKQLSGGHTDDAAVTGDPDYGWGWIVDKGFDIIQTDWVMPLKMYLKSR